MDSLKRFFETFGYVVIRNVYDKFLLSELEAEYDQVASSHFGKSVEDFLKNPIPMVHGVESSQKLLDFVQNSRVLPIIEELLGEDAVFWGSDLSTFNRSSQFHRDAIGDYHLVKAGIYLQDTTEKDGGQFCCIPGSHLYGDAFSAKCSEGLLWPKTAGYANDSYVGDLDLETGGKRQVIPSVKIDLSVGDIIFFNPALVHSVPASNRLRRMIALSFFEGEKSFNSRPRVKDEFFGLSHTETYIALRLSMFMVERTRGLKTQLNYYERLGDFNIDGLRKYLKSYSRDELEGVNNRMIKNSFEAAYRFVTKTNPG
jgi:ectoine hydroxylase-related dioxygenase (phytanoyl-CoA dioxygenase family)